ncbi:hypothetical protein KY284_029780 [Solanum tuberosum]|nr:hypothetical protein KY284_029780 [Solanum tuberosum]
MKRHRFCCYCCFRWLSPGFCRSMLVALTGCWLSRTRRREERKTPELLSPCSCCHFTELLAGALAGRSCCPAEAALERQSSGAAACSSLPAREEKAEGFCRCSTPRGGLAGKGEEREKASSPLLAFAGKMARRERGGGSDPQGKRGGESKCFKVLVD